MKLLPLLLCFAAYAYAGTFDTREATEEIFRSLGKQTAERVAERLSDISQIHKCLESPILNVPLPRQVAAMERVLLALQDPIPDNCKDNLIQQIWMGVVRTRVTRSLRTCEEDLKHPRVGTIMMELKKEIMKTIREMTKNTGGDCHLERLMMDLPSLVDIEVAKDCTFGNFLLKMATYTQTYIRPLSTGGSTLNCNVDKLALKNLRKRVENYLEEGFKETLERIVRDGDLKQTLQKMLEDGFENIVTGLEKLIQKYQKGEPKECFMEIFVNTVARVIADVRAARLIKDSGAEMQILETVHKMINKGESEKFVKTILRIISMNMEDRVTSPEEFERALNKMGEILESENENREGRWFNLVDYIPYYVLPNFPF